MTPALALLLLIRFPAQDMDLRTSRDVAELLREAPGVTVLRADETALLLRGADPAHVRVLWNGVELDEPYANAEDASRLTTAGITAIEVHPGPQIYGSGAAAGVINLITEPTRTQLRVTGEAGGDGLRLANATAAYVNAWHSATASVETLDDGGTRNADRHRDTAQFLWRFTLPTFSIGLMARAVDHERGIPLQLTEEGTALEPSLERRDGNDRLLAFPITQTLGRFSYDLTLSESRRDDQANDPADREGFLTDRVESRTRRARLATHIGGFTLGGEYERAEASETTTFGPYVEDAKQTATAFFLEQQVSRDLGGDARIEATAGIRYDRYDDTFGGALSPRIALAYLRHGVTYHAAFGDGFRAPSLHELYDPFFGEDALQPERGRTVEAGVSTRGFDVTAFQSEYRNRILFDVSSQRFANSGEARIRGFDLAYARTIGDLTTRLSYTHLAVDEQLLRRPGHAGSLFVGYRAGRVCTNGVLLYRGTQRDLQRIGPFEPLSTSAAVTIDTNLQLDLGRFTPYLKLENATDAKAEDIAGYASPRRRVVLGIRYVL
jgi:vitamin B12 transporter